MPLSTTAHPLAAATPLQWLGWLLLFILLVLFRDDLLLPTISELFCGVFSLACGILLVVFPALLLLEWFERQVGTAEEVRGYRRPAGGAYGFVYDSDSGSDDDDEITGYRRPAGTGSYGFLYDDDDESSALSSLSASAAVDGCGLPHTSSPAPAVEDYGLPRPLPRRFQQLAIDQATFLDDLVTMTRLSRSPPTAKTSKKGAFDDVPGLKRVEMYGAWRYVSVEEVETVEAVAQQSPGLESRTVAPVAAQQPAVDQQPAVPQQPAASAPKSFTLEELDNEDDEFS